MLVVCCPVQLVFNMQTTLPIFTPIFLSQQEFLKERFQTNVETFIDCTTNRPRNTILEKNAKKLILNLEKRNQNLLFYSPSTIKKNNFRISPDISCSFSTKSRVLYRKQTQLQEGVKMAYHNTIIKKWPYKRVARHKSSQENFYQGIFAA